MKRKIRRRCIGFGLLFLGGFAALNVIAYNQARTMMCFARAGSRTPAAESLSFPQKIKTLFCGVNIPRPYNAGKPEDLAPGSVAVKIPCADGPMLGAWYCPQFKEFPAAHHESGLSRFPAEWRAAVEQFLKNPLQR